MEATRPPRSRWRRRLAGLLFAALLLLVGVEFGFRWLAPHLRWGNGSDEPTIAQSIRRARLWYLEGRSGGFEARAYVGFARPVSQAGVNEAGFDGPEWAVEKTPGTLRIVCMGGSTTAGGNPQGPRGSYPHLLEQRLRELSGRTVEVLNCGVSSWTTAEMVCSWFLNVQDYQPDLVILHEVVNDTEARNWPDFRADYSHYRVPWSVPHTSELQRWLIANSDFYAWRLERGAPLSITFITTRATTGHVFTNGGFDPATARAYQRNMLSIGRSARVQGAHMMLATLPTVPHEGDFDLERGRAPYRAGIAEHNQLMREIAAQESWMLCDLELQMLQLEAAGAELFLDLVHVSPQGNDFKALAIARKLLAEWEPLRSSSATGSATSSTAGSTARD
jgi:hypothetical protein